MNSVIFIKILKIVGVILIILFGFFCFIMCYLLGFTLIAEKDIINTTMPLDKQGYVLERKVKIKKEGAYMFILDFIAKSSKEDKGMSHDELIIFLRGEDRPSSNNGTPIPIKLTLYTIDKYKELLLEKEHNTNGTHSWGIDRKIASIRLNTGWYTIRFETLKDFPELENQKVILTVYRYSRNK